MKKLILPIVLLLMGIGGGVGAGLMLTPPPEEEMVENVCVEVHNDDLASAPPQQESTPAPLDSREYARMSNQFVVPVVDNDKVTALIVMSLSVEVESGGKDSVFSHEPRLRDAFLQVLFDHANMGGFDGAFTASSNMRLLREALQSTADQVMHGHITDVLITEIVRQDVIQ